LEHRGYTYSTTNTFFKEKAKQFCSVLGPTPVSSHTPEKLASSVHGRHLQRDKEAPEPHSGHRDQDVILNNTSCCLNKEESTASVI